MLKMCIIGSGKDLRKASGDEFDFVEAESKREVLERLRRMSSCDYSVIYITEDFFDVIYEDSTKYDEGAMPKVRSIAPQMKMAANG